MQRLLDKLPRALRVEGGVLLTFVILATLALAFLKLASEVTEGETLGFDRAIMLALRQSTDTAIPAGPAWLKATMLDITAIGGTSVLTLLTIAVAGFLLVLRKAATAGFVLAAILGGAIFSFALKAMFARPRPDLVAHLVAVDTSSFPSGHAMNSAIVYLTLGILLARTQKGHAVRIYLISVAIALTLAVGFSRVYLGVHWPSDVIAGWCVGGAWALLCGALARLLQKRHQIEQPDDAAGNPDLAER
jgi:undecaprenyl-diphosphatase